MDTSNAQTMAGQMVESEQKMPDLDLKKAFTDAALQDGLGQLDDLFTLVKAKGLLGWEPDGNGGWKMSIKVAAPNGTLVEGTMRALADQFAKNPTWRKAPETAGEARAQFMKKS